MIAEHTNNYGLVNIVKILDKLFKSVVASFNKEFERLDGVLKQKLSELESYAKEMKEKGIGKCAEDVLSYALFPQVAEKFFAVRDAAPVVDENGVRNLVVEDLSE